MKAFLFLQYLHRCIGWTRRKVCTLKRKWNISYTIISAVTLFDLGLSWPYSNMYYSWFEILIKFCSVLILEQKLIKCIKLNLPNLKISYSKIILSKYTQMKINTAHSVFTGGSKIGRNRRNQRNLHLKVLTN